MAEVPPQKQVYVDESGINTAMTRTRGRAPPGERAVADAPQGHWKTLTMLGALRLDGIAAAVTIEAATDAEVFRTFVTQALAPTLRPGDVVVWDGLAAHRAAQVEEVIEKRHATLLPLPPYSPDLNPIEPCWSKVKQQVRSANARDADSLRTAAAKAFASVTPADARGWFKHCGVGVH